MAAEIGASELMLVLILLCVVVVPIAAIAFAKSGKGLENIGKGAWSIDREAPPSPGETPGTTDPAEREAEVRQMVEAADFRRRGRGEAELDIEAETDRLLGIGPGDQPGPGDPPAEGGSTRGGESAASDSAGSENSGSGAAATEAGGEDPGAGSSGIREEVRQLVVANNERRERRGEDPLDVNDEVERRLRKWT
ncbi:MAG: hypothetical protein JJE10_03805 [Thermoleophilia bacterium]|nr:hypothetical protein [Thermoleophilia bacterium]